MNIHEENLFCVSLASQFWAMAGIWRLINSYGQKSSSQSVPFPGFCGSKQ